MVPEGFSLLPVWLRMVFNIGIIFQAELLFYACRPAALDHYKAAMLLSGVGDAIGYRYGLWEFNKSGPAIHQVSKGSLKK